MENQYVHSDRGEELEDGTRITGESFLEKRWWVQLWTGRETKMDSLSLDEETHVAEAPGEGVNMLRVPLCTRQSTKLHLI